MAGHPARQRLAMLFRADLHDRLRTGEVTVAFRRWKRPTVVAGGTLRSPVGVLAIDEVDEIRPEDINRADARAAGFDTPDAVLEPLADAAGRRLYRVRFHLAGTDPRVELREQAELGIDERRSIEAQLDRWDRASSDGPWTRTVLETIAQHPGVRSGDLAAHLGVEQRRFKRRVRQLKELGLTESLEVGYRLAPRGSAFRGATAPKRSPGRPLDPDTTARLCSTARDLFTDEGWAGVSIAAVARRSGVPKSAIYRRWPSAQALVFDALFSTMDGAAPLPDTGDALADVCSGMQAFVTRLREPTARDAARAVAAAMLSEPAAQQRWEEAMERDRAAIAAVFASGLERGDLVSELPPDVLAETCQSWVVVRGVIRDAVPSDAEIAAFVAGLFDR